MNLRDALGDGPWPGQSPAGGGGGGPWPGGQSGPGGQSEQSGRGLWPGGSSATGPWFGGPGVPSGPSGPSGPGAPGTWFGGPGVPSGPSGPGAPGPWPCGPSGPSVPSGPSGPGATGPWPCGPSGPSGPSGPGATGPWPCGPSGPSGPSMPSHPSRPHQAKSLDVPYKRTISGENRIIIRGTPKSNANGFKVDLRNNNDIVFHFNPRFKENGREVIVCNSCLCGRWGREERCTKFPFAHNKDFTMEIASNGRAYTVTINNNYGCAMTYGQRADHRSVNNILIAGDITLSDVQIM